jgi:hypothetical protein
VKTKTADQKYANYDEGAAKITEEQRRLSGYGISFVPIFLV